MNARRRRLVTTTSPAGEVACCLPASPCARAACSRSWCNADTPIAVLHSGAALTITVGSAPWKLVMGRHPGKQGCWAAAAQGGHGLAGRQCRAQVQRAPGAMCPLTELRGWPWVCHFSHVKFPPGLGWRASRTGPIGGESLQYWTSRRPCACSPAPRCVRALLAARPRHSWMVLVQASRCNHRVSLGIDTCCRTAPCRPLSGHSMDVMGSAPEGAHLSPCLAA